MILLIIRLSRLITEFLNNYMLKGYFEECLPRNIGKRLMNLELALES